jgi:hypothetical protein
MRRYGTEREAWWRVVVDPKFGSLWGGWYSFELVGAFVVGLCIKKGWETFLDFSRFEVEDGATDWKSFSCFIKYCSCEGRLYCK